MEAFVTWWAEHIGKLLSPLVSTFLVSLLPIIELRGGLILASLLKVPLWQAVFVAVIGNILPVPFILWGIESFLHWLVEHRMSRLATWIERKVEKNKEKIETVGLWGLVLFVGIPLPGTGAWTGSLLAAVLDMDRKKASLAIALGVGLAACIMTILSYGFLGNIVH
ncbi:MULTISPECIES: small multi-drug export protein [Terrabacteria group]|uniref:COG2426 family protein n=1 Tax=Bacillati TaxID=1783272 RepID=UPI001939366E|nr:MULTISPECIES: small multi-drug export protein [Terrabacteria group]MBW9212727.1 small multi-drug export protein [Trueperella sp. zg.1013]QRG86554.1 small multi-drug export protein [Bulleidia sp. zg-1006]